jgi:hypothetical protein
MTQITTEKKQGTHKINANKRKKVLKQFIGTPYDIKLKIK